MTDAYRTAGLGVGNQSEATSGPLTDLLRNGVALLSAGSGAIHFAVIQSHFEEYWLFGIFFAVLAWLQILWALVVVARPTRLVALTGALINGVAVAVWVWTRTIGVPVGPEPGSPEMAEFIDVLATMFELLVVIGAVALAFVRPAARRFGRTALLALTLVLTVAVSSLTSAAIISFSPHTEEEEQTETGSHEEEEGSSATLWSRR
jgi:hypothetical protein